MKPKPTAPKPTAKVPSTRPTADSPASRRDEQVWFTASNETPDGLPPPTNPVIVRAPLRDELDDERRSMSPNQGKAFAIVSLLLVALAVGGTVVFLAVPSAHDAPLVGQPPPAAPATPEPVGTTTLTGADQPARREAQEAQEASPPPPPTAEPTAPAAAPPPVSPPQTNTLRAPGALKAPGPRPMATPPPPRPAAKPTPRDDGLPPDLDRAQEAAGLPSPNAADPTGREETPAAASPTAPAETVEPSGGPPHLELKR